MRELGLIAEEPQLQASYSKEDRAKSSTLNAALQDAGTRAVIETMIQQKALKERQEEEVDALCRLLHNLKQTHRQPLDLRLESPKGVDTNSFVRFEL